MLTDIFAGLDGDLNEGSTERDMSGAFTAAQSAMRFMLAGNATITARSKATGNRFTYRMRASEDHNMTFVSVLTGPDNEGDFCYLGHIPTRNNVFFHGRKSKIAETAPSAKAFKWIWQKLAKDQMPDTLELWHEGRCGRCNRKLTVPESIESGFGPECINKLGAM